MPRFELRVPRAVVALPAPRARGHVERAAGAAFVTAVALIVGSSEVAAAQGVELRGTFVDYVAVGADGALVCPASDCGVAKSMRYREATGDPGSCDLYAPGTTHETFTLEVTTAGGVVRLTNSGAGPDAISTIAEPTVSGRAITWSGRAVASGVDLRVDQRVELESDDRVVRLTVTLTNEGGALTDVYYLRNGDPDIGQCNIGTSFETANDVRRQPPTDPAALATARGGDGASAARTIVLGIGAHDERARVHTGGFANVMAAAEWSAPLDQDGALRDDSVDIVFREASLASGASTSFEVLYVWGPSEAIVEARFDALGFPTAPCVGLADGATCATDAGAAGLCREGRCCTGCWDGERCHGGSSAARCGIAGASCVACADGNLCTSEVCTAGLCASPPSPAGTRCDDGLFCTASDVCDGAGGCVGSGARCDDGESCTVDVCDEAADACTHDGRPEGTACTRYGQDGQCREAACCTGCFDGAACRAGNARAACGRGGDLCASCVDGDPCTDDVCAGGVCASPFAAAGTRCDDGVFCTASDACDGAGACEGRGARCDDGQACTDDACDEALDRCVNVVTTGCSIGGECVEAGATNASYPCQVCDPPRDDRDWSVGALDAACGHPFCAAGRLFAPGCDARGACVTETIEVCASGRCAEDGVTCAEGCTPEACGDDRYCDADLGVCMARRADGAACALREHCASGHCVDGVCCASRCDAGCERCDGVGSVGRCRAIDEGLDPDDECALACDGRGTCQLADAGPPDAALPLDAGADARPSPLDAALIPHDAGAARRGGCHVASPASAPPASVLALAALAIRRRRRGGRRRDGPR